MIDWSFVLTFIVAFGIYEIGKFLLRVIIVVVYTLYQIKYEKDGVEW